MEIVNETPAAEDSWDWDDIQNEWNAWQQEKQHGLDSREAWDDNAAWDEDAAQWNEDGPGEDEKPKARRRAKKACKNKKPEAINENAVEEKEKSFARRPPPKGESKYMRWSAARAAFVDKVEMWVDYPSKYQDLFWEKYINSLYTLTPKVCIE